MEPLRVKKSVHTDRRPKVCNDCQRKLDYGKWIYIRCTIGEDEASYYCYKCFVGRMERYVACQKELFPNEV
jgi:hypothetical protein